MTLSTRIGVMNHGKIMQVSPPRDMYEFPNSKFVAEFIGSVNIFEGLVEVDEPDHVQVRCPDMDIPFYASHGISCSPEQTVWIALRPEKIRLSHSAPEQSKNYSRGTIAEIAYMGGLSIYKVRLPSGKHVRVTQPNFARHMDEGFDWDDEVYISWGATSAVVLTS
jgi:putrescine transport system ATP-binding protein